MDAELAQRITDAELMCRAAGILQCFINVLVGPQSHDKAQQERLLPILVAWSEVWIEDLHGDTAGSDFINTILGEQRRGKADLR